jgi:uncharacterized protein with HEPN domain
MQLESKKFLYDISIASNKLLKFVDTKCWDDYCQDDLLKSAVERQFEIIGEALNQLSKVDTRTVVKITNYQQIISFRNILIHGYADVDDRLVWNVIETKLSLLVEQVDGLIK